MGTAAALLAVAAIVIFTAAPNQSVHADALETPTIQLNDPPKPEVRNDDGTLNTDVTCERAMRYNIRATRNWHSARANFLYRQDVDGSAWPAFIDLDNLDEGALYSPIKVVARCRMSDGSTGEAEKSYHDLTASGVSEGGGWLSVEEPDDDGNRVVHWRPSVHCDGGYNLVGRVGTDDWFDIANFDADTSDYDDSDVFNQTVHGSPWVMATVADGVEVLVRMRCAYGNEKTVAMQTIRVD